MNVIKRDGRETKYDLQKIKNAISRANNETQELTEEKINIIVNDIASVCRKYTRSIAVDEIQEIVETELMKHKAYETAKHYIRYRYQKTIDRRQNTTDSQIMTTVNLENEEVKQENSNKNPTIISTQRDYVAGLVSRDLTDRYLLPKDITEAHKKGIIHFHDSDYFIQKSHNCDLVNLEDMLQNGTVINGVKIEKPHSFITACTIMTQIMAIVASCQYGGQTMSLSHIAPFVDVSRKHLFHEVQLELSNAGLMMTADIVDSIVTARLKDEIKKGVQTIQYQILTLNSSNGQTPFVTLFMYLNECKDQQTKDDLALIIEEVLKQRTQGVKNEKGVWITPAFPKLLYVLEEDNIYPESKYYYLTELAAKCTAKRMVPDYISEKIMLQLKGDCYPNMGALASHEHLIVKINNGIPQDLSIKELFEYCKNNEEIKGRPSQIYYPNKFTGESKFLGKHSQDKNRSYTAEYRPGVYKITYIPQDVSYIGSSSKVGQRWNEHHVSIRTTGGLDCGVLFNDQDLHNYKFEVLEYTDDYKEREKYYIMHEPNINVRGISRKYYKVSTRNSPVLLNRPEYIPDLSKKQELIDLNSFDIKVLDRDNQWTHIKHIFKNDKLNTPLMMEIVYQDNDKKYSLSCTEDHPLWNGETFVRADKLHIGDNIYRGDNKLLKIIQISWYREPQDSYDIGTETGTFIGSDIIMHNCRSFLTPDRFSESLGNLSNAKNYVEGKHKYYGRFNQGVVTLNLIDIACSSKKNIDKFWKLFDERCELCHKALRIRHERLLGTPSDVAPILWQYGALARLQKGETIDKLLFNGYSTISLGYAGLWETVYYMTGKKLTEPEGKKFGLQIMNKLNEYTEKWKNSENIDYSLYGTPIESTTYKFAKCLQERFGIIKGVTDKNYITNSYHVHVTENIDAFSKLQLESEFQKLSPGGAISYVEVPNMENNLQAVLNVIKFIYDHIMYAELNTKSDYCQVCGYNGEILIKEDEDGKLFWECPQCGNRDQSKMNVARRTCGYIGSQFWNQGRTQEIKDRVLHL